eukprot:1588815-Prymnesium_polylepis.1
MASLVTTVIITNLGLLLIFVALTVYHAMFHKSMQVLRLVSSREVPDLELAIGMQYHVFLSHIWSSGQVKDCISRSCSSPQYPASLPFENPVPLASHLIFPLLGQDQTANIKRMLQLLLPGANIFLGSPHFHLQCQTLC